MGVAALAMTLGLIVVPAVVLTFAAHRPEAPPTRASAVSAAATMETLPSWWTLYPGASAEVSAFFEDDVKAAATIVVTSSAAMTEVVEFYRRLLLDAGYVLVQDRLRPGVAAVVDARRSDGSEVRLTAVAGSVVILYDEVRRPATTSRPVAEGGPEG